MNKHVESTNYKNKKKIKIEIKVVDYPSKEFDKYQKDLTKLYHEVFGKIEKKVDPEMKPFDKSQVIIGFYKKTIVGYMVVMEAMVIFYDYLNEIGIRYYTINDAVKEFVASGGLPKKKNGYGIIGFGTERKKYRKVGTQIMNYFLKHFHNNVDYSFLHTTLDNYPAIEFYERVGFKIVSEYDQKKEKFNVMRIVN